jgi:nucleoside-diphosphate-sugar epimerase
MRVVLAGAGGVAGRGLVPLLSSHHHVIGLDRPEVAPAPGLQWLVADIRDWRGLRNALAAVHPVDALVVAVAAPNAGLGPKDQARVQFDVTVTGSWTLFTEALDAGLRRIVYVSTMDVHGDTPDPAEPYGLANLLAEKLLEYLCATRGTSGVALRIGRLHVEDLAEAIDAALTDDVPGFAARDVAATRALDTSGEVDDWSAPIVPPLGSVPLPPI